MKRRYDVLYKNLIGMGAALICFLLLLPTLRFIPIGAQLTVDTGRDTDLFDLKIQPFFRALALGNSTAFDELLRGGPLGASDPEAVRQRNELRNNTDEMKRDFGEIINNAWERFETKKFGEDVVVVRYVLKYEQYPVIWTFTFYRKPTATVTPTTSLSGSWTLIGLEFDTNLR